MEGPLQIKTQSEGRAGVTAARMVRSGPLKPLLRKINENRANTVRTHFFRMLEMNQGSEHSGSIYSWKMAESQPEEQHYPALFPCSCCPLTPTPGLFPENTACNPRETQQPPSPWGVRTGLELLHGPIPENCHKLTWWFPEGHAHQAVFIWTDSDLAHEDILLWRGIW